jgi:hypothetical protein
MCCVSEGIHITNFVISLQTTPLFVSYLLVMAVLQHNLYGNEYVKENVANEVK